MTEPTEKNELIIYENIDTAPFVILISRPPTGSWVVRSKSSWPPAF
jgi:hypothetical protein